MERRFGKRNFPAPAGREVERDEKDGLRITGGTELSSQPEKFNPLLCAICAKENAQAVDSRGIKLPP